ncbi:MAG TPA: NADH-quinone oxidoreductase subunit A, partial [Acidobacteriota bacterium]
MLFDFASVLVFLILGGAFVAVNLLIGGLVRPAEIERDKGTVYECGEEPVGQSWIQFNPRFYVIALVFLIFDVEVAFLLPWAVSFKQLGLLGFLEMATFVAILLVGLAYVWARGDLE